MREIKFRAWDKKHNKMSDGFDMWDFAYTTDSENGNWQYGFQEDYGKGNMILMQFTGLKDKNGKEIYEGDIVKPARNAMEGEIGEVWWQDASGYWAIDWDGSKNLGKYDYQIGHHLELEVIGNIYENPELLKGKE